jgi:hypothetical protein
VMDGRFWYGIGLIASLSAAALAIAWTGAH